MAYCKDIGSSSRPQSHRDRHTHLDEGGGLMQIQVAVQSTMRTS